MKTARICCFAACMLLSSAAFAESGNTEPVIWRATLVTGPGEDVEETRDNNIPVHPNLLYPHPVSVGVDVEDVGTFNTTESPNETSGMRSFASAVVVAVCDTIGWICNLPPKVGLGAYIAIIYLLKWLKREPV